MHKMSISTSCLVVFLLCLSLHACNARHLRQVDKMLGKKIHFSIKSDEKMGSDKISALSKVQASLSKQNGVAKIEDVAEILSNESTQKRKETRTNEKTSKVEGKTPDAVQTESLVSVSWHVPHKEHSEKNPGFNLDYSPPKTHPPSHN